MELYFLLFVASQVEHVRLNFVVSLGDGHPFADTWVLSRVVGSCGLRRMVDLVFLIEELDSWCLWIWVGRPILELYWDPWEMVMAACYSFLSTRSFFQYSVACVV